MARFHVAVYETRVMAGICLAAVLVVAHVQLGLTFLPAFGNGEWQENSKLIKEHPESFVRCNRCVGPQFQIEIAFFVTSWLLAALGIFKGMPLLVLPWIVNIPAYSYVLHQTVYCALDEDANMNRWPASAPKVAYLLKDYHLIEKLGTNKAPAETASSGKEIIDPAFIAAGMAAFPAIMDEKNQRTLPVYWNKQKQEPIFWDILRGHEKNFRDENIWRCPYAVHNNPTTLEVIGKFLILLGSVASCGAFLFAANLASAVKEIHNKLDRQITRTVNRVNGQRETNNAITQQPRRCQHTRLNRQLGLIGAGVVVNPRGLNASAIV